MHQISDFIIVSLATVAIAYTISRTHIFEYLRWWIEDKAQQSNSEFWVHLDTFIKCPYCVSHWIALILVLVFNLQVIDSGDAWYQDVVDYVVTAFAVVGLATIFGYVVHRSYIPVVPRPGVKPRGGPRLISTDDAG